VADLQTALDYVLQDEKGWANNPKDPGGATNRGITLAMFIKYRQMKGAQVAPGIDDLQNISDAETLDFYDTIFWKPLMLDQLTNQVIATCILDIQINTKFGTAILCAQQACGFAVCDGVMGPKTIAALNTIDSTTFLCDSEIGKGFLPKVKAYYVALCNNSGDYTFLDGWLNRTLRMVSLLKPVQSP
jgi:lysozyme family protein